MNVLIVSGIWPPDVGGPASHAPELARFLAERGHRVAVVTTADRQPAAEPFPVHWASRRLPKGALHGAALAAIARQRADVVYSTGMFSRTAAACALTRRPFVLKLTGDPAFERSRRRGGVTGDVEEFQRGGGGGEAAALRVVRTLTLRGAARVVCPSEYLRSLALGWGVAPGRLSVLPNAAPPLRPSAPRNSLRAALGIEGPAVAFAGRFGPQKALDILAAATARAGVRLLLAGEGGDAPRAPHIRELGPLSRDGVVDLFAAADAAVLSSAWENFPHTLVEALAVGTPVIATRVGGVGEIVEDGVNGLLVPPGDAEALAGALRRYFDDDGLQARLRRAAAPSVERFSPERVYGELERILEDVAR